MVSQKAQKGQHSKPEKCHILFGIKVGWIGCEILGLGERPQELRNVEDNFVLLKIMHEEARKGGAARLERGTGTNQRTKASHWL